MEKDDKGPKRVAVQHPIRVRKTAHPGGECVEARSVLCKTRGVAVSPSVCEKCPAYLATTSTLGGTENIVCRDRVPDEETVGLRSFFETPVHEIIGASALCFDCEMSLNEASRAFEEARVRVAPVVEDKGVLLGVVSQADCVTDAGAEDGMRPLVEDVMRPAVSVGASDSIRHAAQVLAESGLESVPVVSSQEVVVGLLSPMDIVRWIARLRLP